MVHVTSLYEQREYGQVRISQVEQLDSDQACCSESIEILLITLDPFDHIWVLGGDRIWIKSNLILRILNLRHRWI